jgi:hypothetical protein
VTTIVKAKQISEESTYVLNILFLGDYWVFGTYPSSDILKNIIFRKLDPFPKCYAL